jgi:hypothetical protein
VVAIIVTVGVAYILGVAAAGIVQKYRSNKFRAEKTRELLDRMGTGLAVGVALPEGDLEDLTGTPIKLSEAVGTKSFVSFFTPDCGACKMMLEGIKKTALDSEVQSRFVLISDVHPTEMMYLEDSLDLHCRFLYDPEGVYKDRLGVFSFPFNLVVDQSLVIKDIIAGAPDEDELAEIGEYH